MPYVVFEGIDGSGTTTQSKRVVKSFKERGLSAQWTCEPTGGPIGTLVRDFFEGRLGRLPSWRTMFHLFQADREQHYVRIQEWLEDNCFVVSDRSWFSSLVYQVTSAEEAGEKVRRVTDLIEECNEHAPQPDVTILLDVPVDEALKRLNKNPDHYEKKEFLEMVRNRYLEIIGKPPIRRVYTSGKTIDETFELVDKELRQAGF